MLLRLTVLLLALCASSAITGCNSGSDPDPVTAPLPDPDPDPDPDPEPDPDPDPDPEPVPGSLRIQSSPSTGEASTVLGTVVVSVLDTLGSVYATTPVEVTLELVGSGGSSTAAVLGGQSTATTVEGVARFDDLTIDRGGEFALRASAAELPPVLSDRVTVERAPLHVILMIADGWGPRQLEALRSYTGSPTAFDDWDSIAMASYDLDTETSNGGVGYDPVLAWSDFAYLTAAATDSAAAATAMYTGQKTDDGNVCVSAGDSSRLVALPELAEAQELGLGAVTSVPFSHATPAAWLAHNDARTHYAAIADEMLFGDPNTTGTPADSASFSGGWGPSIVRADVIIGGGHPNWAGPTYLSMGAYDRVVERSGEPSEWTLIERSAGLEDSAARLVDAAADAERIFGLFGGASGNIDYRLADDSGRQPENPTLEEMTRGALARLERESDGFLLMVEGGAIDWAGHQNNMNRSIGELRGFDAAVKAVTQWVEDPSNASSWENTLVIATGDHETGLLTAAPGVFPDAPLGEVTNATIAAERTDLVSGNRASWDDANSNAQIDAGETIHWYWNSSGHSNQLIPLYSRGVGSERFQASASFVDPVLGDAIDNTQVFEVIRATLLAPR